MREEKELLKGLKMKYFHYIMIKKMKNNCSLKKKKKKKKTFNTYKFNEWVNKQETSINKKLFKNYFFFQIPSALLKKLYKTDDKEKTISECDQ